MGAVRLAGSRSGGRPLRGEGGRLIDGAGATGPQWAAVERSGSPRELHAVGGTPGRRQVVVSWPGSGAVVLGSTQAVSDFDPARCARAGLELVRRRSGGGAVLVRPGEQVWVDFYLPASDPLFCPDVSRSFLWLGELWARALRAMAGVPGTVEVATSSHSTGGEWGRRLCFCSVVSGEVLIGGKKVVGLCQRRDRSGAWFHTMALTSFDFATIATLVAGGGEARRAAAAALDAAATALPGGAASSGGVVTALFGVLDELGGVAA